MKHNPNTDDMATNSRKQNTTSNSQLVKTLMEGLDGNRWGYGLRRISVTVNPDVDVGFHHQVPYTFTSLGYKDQNGKWYVGLRMNIDQVSPLKMRPMNANTDLTNAWAEMMREFVREYVNKHKQ
tara:strand:+ start:129 stop:500 length:372 start_codon:yes stop_codon:yes gene_type:complete